MKLIHSFKSELTQSRNRDMTDPGHMSQHADDQR